MSEDYESEVDRSTLSLRQEVVNEVDQMLPDRYNAVDLLGQADVWLSTELMHYNRLEVRIDYDRLRETTDYEENE